ncbi:hypothetical protein GCM10011414_17610 [Croceivirga lutea]|uniref:hypothetical protein n=1 Tax=Croceivirga lutea TaxID=1775167 RepID=UPI00163B4F78|nr:hypothetical protein [Croceivirga lutea]GGG48313.1 hypothetical protein GCM10011414_17610 [Croceivirga lutea]
MGLLNKIIGNRKNGKSDNNEYSKNIKKKTNLKEHLLPNSEAHGFPIHKRHREKIVNKIVEIDAKEFVGSFLECHFIDCEIKIRCSAKYTYVLTNKCTFENCLIWAHTKQIGGNWNPKFKNCSFKGRFELRFENKLINCDFSQTKISTVGLLENNTLDEITGVTYPTIAILDLKNNVSALEKIKTNDNFKDFIWASKRDSGLIIFNIQEFTCEPEKLWNSIKHLEFIITSHNDV